jgi:AraC-like DNA-binding protein
MRKLREQELPPPSNSQAITHRAIPKAEQKMSVEELAKEVGLSETRLRALFKSDLGLTPRQYVKKTKMETAAEMAGKSYKRVTEIAAELGFNGDSHFVRVFKQTYGMTPTEYRKLHQQRSERENTTPSRPAIISCNE